MTLDDVAEAVDTTPPRHNAAAEIITKPALRIFIAPLPFRTVGPIRTLRRGTGCRKSERLTAEPLL
ncbi:hypothetical protein GCM10009789_03980 [Kribbella sancticallisti]|uniref:Uncharacterized protein n=1 Tax=Kribbella sancticallisti TaxID=460087 RepID=A0ABP4N0L1_9ACTN